MTRYEVMKEYFSKETFEKYLLNCYGKIGRSNMKTYEFLHEDGFDEYDSHQILDDSFSWIRTPEGDGFWRDFFEDMGGEAEGEDYEEDND